jgi:hypothetical protein
MPIQAGVAVPTQLEPQIGTPLAVDSCIGRVVRLYLIASRSNFSKRRTATITCPHCAVRKTEIMPTDACQFFYECTGCGAKLKPRAGDYCVFCSNGSVSCPPIQAGRSGRGGGRVLLR